MNQQRNDGTIALYIGVSRSGKSIPLKRAAEQHKRCIAIDPKGEMHSQLGFEVFHDKYSLLERAIEVGDGDAQLCFVTNNKKDFDFFCDVAFNFNRVKPCCIVVEELALYTNSASAGGYWGRLVNQGLAFEPTILATVQRGQEVDKTIMNNASFIHVTRHNTTDDQAYIAFKLGIDPDEIPTEKLKFLQWTSDKKIVCKGTVGFKKATSKNWPRGIPEFRAGGKLQSILPNGQFKSMTYS